MPIFLAEIGKKKFLLSSETMAKAGEVLRFYHKNKTIKITEGALPDPLIFKIGAGAVCTSTKIKENVVSFTTSNNMTGRVDMALLPLELVQALP